MTPARKELVKVLVIGVVAAVIGTWASLQIDWFPPQAVTAADDIDTLYDWLLVASVPIFVLVMTVAIYSVVKFRYRPGVREGDGAPIHGHTRLEIVWVTIPFIIVSVLAVYAAVVLADIEEKKPNELKVHVVGQQFTWHFEYPGGLKSDVLYLPKDRPVRFAINTKDVLHSFWVPAFRLKSDAVPGQTTVIRLTPNKLGAYDVVCAELCGLGHSTMRVRALVVSKERFAEFIASKKKRPGGGGQAAAGGQAGGGANLAATGKQIFTGEGGCGACHTLADAATTGAVGPNLSKIGRASKAELREMIVDPNKEVASGFPADTMPSDFEQRLGKEKIDALVAYLLEAGK